MVRIGLAGTLLLLAGCGAEPAVQREAMIEQTLFVADSRNGQVRVFDLRNGPVARATLIAPPRRAVHDLRADASRSRLWVLGDDALYAYDARSLVLDRRLPLPTNTTAMRTLSIEDDGTPLLVSGGQRIRLRSAGA